MRLKRTSVIRSVAAFGIALAGATAFYNLDLIAPFGPDKNEFPIRGIDVSHYQGTIDWSKVRQNGVKFAYIKATEGDDFVDPQFADNWSESDKAGVLRGAYHVFSFCSDGYAQAKEFYYTVPRDTRALPPAVDVSSGAGCASIPSDNELLTEFETFRSVIEGFFSRRMVFYVNRDNTIAKYLWRTGETRFWVRGLFIHPAAKFGDGWMFWQYSIRGRIDGIETPVDVDTFNGTERDLQSLFSQ